MNRKPKPTLSIHTCPAVTISLLTIGQTFALNNTENHGVRLAFERSNQVMQFDGRDQPSKQRRELAPGFWAGQHISLEITADGGRVEFDCAHATIDEQIILDRNGRFKVKGKHFPERGGPLRQGDESGYPVNFSGQVKGNTMTVRVERDTKESMGTYKLVRDAQPEIVKCK